MKNLFVIHTQYHFLLVCALCMTDFEEDQNDLILFCDFSIDEIHRKTMKRVFGKVQILGGNYPKRFFTSREKIKKMVYDNGKIRDFISYDYDRIFIVFDTCIQEMYALKCTHKKNRNVSMAWLEDGSNAYYSFFNVSGGIASTTLGRLVRKIAFSTLFGMWGYYDLGTRMGTHRLLKQAYLTFPKFARQDLQDSNKELVEISEKAFILGAQELFQGEQYIFEENAIIIALDKFAFYDTNQINMLISNVVNQAHSKGQKIYYKHHPRETERLPILQTETELDSKISLESYLINSNTRNLTVIGVASTSLMSAKRMGYKSISLIQTLRPDHRAIIDFYNKIGIECI